MDDTKVLSYNLLNSHTLRRLVERHLSVRGSLRIIYLTNDFFSEEFQSYAAVQFEICAWWFIEFTKKGLDSELLTHRHYHFQNSSIIFWLQDTTLPRTLTLNELS